MSSKITEVTVPSIAGQGNPIDAIAVQSNSTATETETWTADEMRRFLEAASEDRLYAAWLSTATTGIRCGEVLGPRWSDFSLDVARVSIRRTIVLVKNVPPWSEPKTPRSKRSIPLAPETVAALEAHKAAQAERQAPHGTGLHRPGRRLLARWVGDHPTRFTAAFQRLSQQTGVPKRKFHAVRHTFATLALEAGIHPQVVSEIIGSLGYVGPAGQGPCTCTRFPDERHQSIRIVASSDAGSSLPLGCGGSRSRGWSGHLVSCCSPPTWEPRRMTYAIRAGVGDIEEVCRLETSGGIAVRKLRSLIVDDDDDIRWILSLNLATGPVEVVGEAEDGLEAIELARELEPDIVLMDLVMPRMDGVEATRAIKKRRPKTVVIGFTAVPEQGARLLQAGASAVFSKGSLDELLLTLQGMIPD